MYPLTYAGPPLLLVDDGKDQTRWKACRRERVQASDVAKILGLSPDGGKLRVYGEKVLGEELADAPHLRRGRELEPLVGASVAKERGREYHSDGALYVARDFPLLGATLDGWEVWPGCEVVLYEIKTTTRFREDWGDGVPVWVWVQMQAQLYVTGLRSAICAVRDIWGWVDHWAVVERDDAWIRSVMLPGIRHFWEAHVVPRVPPDPDSSEESLETLARLIQDTEAARVVYLPELFDPILVKWSMAKEVEGEARDEKEECARMLKAAMCGARYAVLPSGRRLKCVRRGESLTLSEMRRG